MQDHMGNRTMQRPGETTLPEMDDTRNLTELGTYIEPAEYLTPHSDVVALMVLEHQTQMLNRIARLGWEARLGRDTAPMVDEFVNYTLLQGEAKLTEPVRGTSGFAEEFSKRGPLYELDLKTRLFRYPCSFLIYSPQWAAMPAEVKTRVYRGMWDAMARWPEADRRALVEILLKTKKGLPDYWKAG